MKLKFLVVILATAVLALNGCSGGAGISYTPPTVLAQTTYSVASLNGTYSVQLVSPFSTSGAAFYSGVGTLQLNGTGTVSGGTIDVYFSASTTPCVYSPSGTYSLQSTALGTASISLTSSTSGCATTETWKMALAAGNSGTNFQFSSIDGNVISGTAVKQ